MNKAEKNIAFTQDAGSEMVIASHHFNSEKKKAVVISRENVNQWNRLIGAKKYDGKFAMARKTVDGFEIIIDDFSSKRIDHLHEVAEQVARQGRMHMYCDTAHIAASVAFRAEYPKQDDETQQSYLERLNAIWNMKGEEYILTKPFVRDETKEVFYADAPAPERATKEGFYSITGEERDFVQTSDPNDFAYTCTIGDTPYHMLFVPHL